jgi:hypothetical protein
MKMPGGLSALLIGAMLTATCQGTSLPSPSTPRSESSAVPTTGQASPAAPLPSLDPAWFAAQAVSCGDELFFSPAVLLQPGREEDGMDPAAIALRTYLAMPAPEELSARPDVGWHRVAQTANQVQFASLEKDGRSWFFVGFMLAHGAWTEGSSGSCAGTVQRPRGLVRADWWLDPDRAPAAVGDRSIRAVVQEYACAGGRSPEGRIQAPAIVYFEDAVVVTMSVRPLPGAHDCPANPAVPFEIQLEQPIEGRRLLDGGVFPPRDATRPPS